MPPDSTLRFGYPLRTKIFLAVPVVACASLSIASLGGDTGFGFWAMLACTLLCLGPLLYVMRSQCRVDAAGLTRSSLFGSRRFLREDYQTFELVSDGPGRPPGLLLRFKTGVVFIDAAQSNRTADEITVHLARVWRPPARREASVLGAVDCTQVFHYEPLHASLSIVLGAVLAMIGFFVPVLWVAAVYAAFCGRVSWRSLGRLETDEEGIAFLHQFLPPVRIRWDEIESVRYWTSLAQGGARIRGAGKTIRVYRWIGNYPKFNRLLHDQISEDKFQPQLALPLAVGMNRRRRAGVLLPYILVMGASLPALWAGNAILFLCMVAIPSLVAPLLVFGSSRSIEVDSDELLDVVRFLWIRKVTHYPRSTLLDARLGRQLHVGGLWLKFGHHRLEIANSDVAVPPEQILACLRREWAWENRTVEDDWSDHLHGAA